MSEKNYETSELKELKDALQTFTEFVWEMEEYLPEFYHFFDAMRQNIEIFLRVGEEDEEQIHEILERDWEKAHAPLNSGTRHRPSQRSRQTCTGAGELGLNRRHGSTQHPQR